MSVEIDTLSEMRLQIESPEDKGYERIIFSDNSDKTGTLYFTSAGPGRPTLSIEFQLSENERRAIANNLYKLARFIDC